MPNKEQAAPVCDATGFHSCNAALVHKKNSNQVLFFYSKFF